jgi:hypothetical protein
MTPNAGLEISTYPEADPILNLRLVRQALPKAAKMAVLVSSRTQSWLLKLPLEAAALGLELHTILANDEEEVERRLREVFAIQVFAVQRKDPLGKRSRMLSLHTSHLIGRR